MAFSKIEEFDINRIKKTFGLTDNRIETVKDKIPELKSIYDNFTQNINTLENYKEEILVKLNKILSDKVHSVRARIKNPDHLIEKIIRNIHEKPDKYTNINRDNYNKIITDLLGVRVIILCQQDWREVHNILLSTFHNSPEKYVRDSDDYPLDIIEKYDKYNSEATGTDESKISYHAEMPVAYIASNDDKNSYKDDNLKVCNSKLHYRSIHYIIRYKEIYFEIQVRTIFEEAWLEFDHRIRYPNDRNNFKKNQLVSILESLALAADRLVSIYDPLDYLEDNKNVINTAPK